MHDFDSRVPDLVRRAHDVPGLHPAAREEHRLRVRVVVAPDRHPAAAMMVVRAPPELAQPDDQRIVQQAPLPQVLDQRGHRLVDAVDARLVGPLEVVVRVPAAREYLHEPHALLDHAPGQQAPPRERSRVLAFKAVHFLDRLGLAFDIDDSGHLGLHPVGEFVVGHASGQFVMPGMLGHVPAIQFRQHVQVLPLVFPRLPSRRVDVQDRRPFRPQRGALVVGWQESVRPVARAALREARLRQHDVARQVLVLAAEAVRYPRADGRVPAELVAGIHVIQRRGMVHRLRLAALVNAKFVRDLREMHEVLAHVDPGLPDPAEPVRTLHVVALSRRHRRELLALALEQLHVQLFELRLGIERVDVARTTFHH